VLADGGNVSRGGWAGIGAGVEGMSECVKDWAYFSLKNENVFLQLNKYVNLVVKIHLACVGKF
jgi:hypothetical protein